MDISGPASTLMYNNFASPMSLVCNPSHNITSPTDLSNNSLSSNDYEIPFLWTSSKNFCHLLSLTLSWSQSTSLPSRQYSSLPTTPSYLWTWHICLFFMCFQNMVFLPISPLTEAWSLCQTFSDLQALLWICSFTSLQATTLKMIDKPNAQIRLPSNISIYIVTSSKTTGLNSYPLWSLSTIIPQVLLLVFFHSSLIRDIIYQDHKKWTQFLFIFFLIFFDLFSIFSIFKTLGIGLEVISHAVTSVTSDGVTTILIIGLKRKKQKVVEQSDIIQHGHHMLTSCLIHGHLGQSAQYLAQTICRSI